MKRRIVSAILCIVICCSCIIGPVVAQEQRTGIYTEQELEDILFKFCNYDSEMNVLFGSDTSVVYWNLSNQISKNDVLRGLLEIASMMIKEIPDKEDYVRILTNILVMKQGNLADQIENQSQFDNLKGLDDYAWDVAEIAVSFVDINKIAELVSPALKTGLDGKELLVSNVENAKYYEMVLKDYAYAESFLNAIYKNAKDEQLREVAKSLLRGNEELLGKRLEYLSDNLEAMATFEWKFFKENLGFSLLKHTDLYGTDEAFKYFVDYGGELIEWVTSVPKLAFKATILAGDLWFGTSDTYNRYQEMKIISDIAQALIADINRINLDTTVTDETLSEINQKCYLYQMLILAHIRGEYLVYKLLTEDAGFASWLKHLTDSFKDSEETVEGRYNSQIEVLEKYYNLLCNLYPQLKQGENEEDENSTNSPQKLTSIITYQNNRKSEEYLFSYNDLGQVVELVAYRYEGGEAMQWYSENYEYDSNANLILTKRGSSQERYQYNYDANGQIKGYSVAWYEGDVLSPESDSYILSYDNQGRIIEKRNEHGSDIQKYSYAESSDAVYAIREYGWADGHFLDKTTYDYTYAPLIIQTSTSESAEYGNSSGKSISFMPHWNLTIASWNIDNSCSFEADTTGSLLTVKDANGSNVYVCRYEENSNDAEQKDSSTLDNHYAKDNISFSDIPSEFVFSSGAGGWGTYLTIEDDGSFKGEYHDSEMGLTGEGYPRGTVYICGFDGKFAEPQKVSEYVYSMKLESLNVKESEGTKYIENEILYIVSEPYGMENADEFYIYLPGASMAELPEAFLSWTHIDRDIRDTLPSGYYGIYNAGGEKGFTATKDDCIWNGDYMYHYQNRKAAIWPRYYGMSHVLFWPESGAAVIDLQFAWRTDNQTEFDAHDANGSGEYHISITINDDMSAVNVSINSAIGNDLTAWGGTSDGHFEAIFINK